MIQELYFAPHSTSRSQNQMNTSVTLRYDTKTEKLQLVDVFGKVKNITIDTDPDDLKQNDLLSTVTTEFIESLGFETAQDTEAKAITVSTGYGLGVSLSGTEYKVYLKKSVITGVINEQVTPDKVRNWFSAQSGIVYNNGTFELDGPFIDNRLTAFLDQAGYVPHDLDTLYYADEETINLKIEEGTEQLSSRNVFSVNQEWLSGFVSGFLDEADVIPLSGGIDISVENVDIDGQETNVISFTGHIPSGILDVWDTQTVTDDISGLGFIQLADVPVYTAGTDIAISDDKVISFTAHIPTGLCDVWADEQNINNISGLGFALRTELHDTQYFADNTSLTLNSESKVFSINQTWLSTFVQSFGFLTEDSDTTYTGSESITVDNNNSININTTWLGTAVTPFAVASISTPEGAIEVKKVVTSTYISSLGFRLASEDKDTTYDAVANGGLTLTSTSFAVDTNWLSTQVSNYIDTRVTSTYIANTGVKITDTIVSEGLGIDVEFDANNTLIQMVSVDPEWLTGQISAYNESNGINPSPLLIAGNGLQFNDLENTRTISISAFIPSAVTDLSDAANYALKTDIPTALADIGDTEANTNYIATLGFILDDKDTKYGVVANGGITVNSDHNFAIDTVWMDNRVSGFANKEDVPTKVSELNNDKSFVTQADLEAVKLSLMQQFANLTLVVDIDGDVNTPAQNIYVETDVPVTSNTTFTGKNITVTELTNSNSFVKFNSAGDVSISKLSSSGNLEKNMENGNTQIAVNAPGRVVITDSTLNQNGYNAIEIGLDPAVEPPKSVLIDGVKFKGELSNNAISIFGTADDAVVTISNCEFDNISNALRISNRTNTKCTINLINCKFGTWASGEYAGPILCQDYTSTTAAEVASANRFAPEKITINMIDCTHNSAPITFSDPVDVCGTGDASQLIYVYAKIAGGLIAYDAAKFPNFSAK